jgi:Ca2+-dependent lipid-binding protein
MSSDNSDDGTLQQAEDSAFSQAVAYMKPGFVKVTVHTGKLIDGENQLENFDPFIVVRFNNQEGRTSVVKSSKNPVWEEGLIVLYFFFTESRNDV